MKLKDSKDLKYKKNPYIRKTSPQKVKRQEHFKSKFSLGDLLGKDFHQEIHKHQCRDQ